MRNLLVALFISFVVSGCALPEADHLVDTPLSKESFVLNERISFKFEGALGVNAEVGLLPGRYSLEKENNLGQFFIGDARSVWWPVTTVRDKTPKKFAIAQGGIWLPKEKNRSPRVYYYADSVIAKDTLKEAIAARAEGMEIATTNRDGQGANNGNNSLKKDTLTPGFGAPLTMQGVAASPMVGVISAIVGRPPIFYMQSPDQTFIGKIRAASSK